MNDEDRFLKALQRNVPKVGDYFCLNRNGDGFSLEKIYDVKGNVYTVEGYNSYCDIMVKIGDIAWEHKIVNGCNVYWLYVYKEC